MSGSTGWRCACRRTRRRCSAPSWRTVECNGSSTRARACRHSRSWPRPARRRCSFTAEAAELALELAGDGQGLHSGRVVLSDGAVRAPAHQLRLSGIAADMHLSAAGLDPAQPNPVSIASIVHEGAPPWFAPLRLTGSVQPKGDQARLRSRARPPGRRRQDARARAARSRAAPRDTQSSICRRSGSRPIGCNPRHWRRCWRASWKTYPASSRCAARLAGARAPTCVPISTCWSRTWRSAPARRALPRSTA